jgi:hypothetical protein
MPLMSSAPFVEARRALVELLMVAPQPGPGSLETALARIASIARRIVPSADGVVMSLVGNDSDIIAATNPAFSTAASIAQLEMGEGPSVSACIENRSFYSASLSTDPRWPVFGRLATAEGIACALSLPLRSGGQTTGTLDFYARTPDTFTAGQIQSAEDFAIPLAVKVGVIRSLVTAQRLAAALQAALLQRVTIEQAVGIVMSRTGGPADEAFHYLQVSSRSRRESVGSFAAYVVDDAVRRAKQRTSDEPEHQS